MVKLVSGAPGGEGGLGAEPIILLMVPNSKRPRRSAPPGVELRGGKPLLPCIEWFPYHRAVCFKKSSLLWALTYFASCKVEIRKSHTKKLYILILELVNFHKIECFLLTVWPYKTIILSLIAAFLFHL